MFDLRTSPTYSSFECTLFLPIFSISDPWCLWLKLLLTFHWWCRSVLLFPPPSFFLEKENRRKWVKCFPSQSTKWTAIYWIERQRNWIGSESLSCFDDDYAKTNAPVLKARRQNFVLNINVPPVLSSNAPESLTPLLPSWFLSSKTRILILKREASFEM